MLYRVVFVVLAIVLLLPTTALAVDEGQEAQSRATVPAIKKAPPGGDFTLQSIDGPVSLQDFRGKLVLLYFGYTSCPDVCPTSLSLVTQALNELSEDELEKVQSIFVSVDPKRDTPEALAQYVGYFHSSMIGVTGTELEVAEVAQLYGAQYYEVEMEGSAFGYSVNHSSVSYLITPEGTLRFIFPHATPASVIVEAIRHLLGGE